MPDTEKPAGAETEVPESLVGVIVILDHQYLHVDRGELDLHAAAREQVSERVDASSSNVVALALHELGAPLTDYQKAQVVAYDELPAMSVMGVRDADGAWTVLEDEEALPEAYADLEQMAYLEFARAV